MSKISSIIKSKLPRKYIYTFNQQSNQYVDPRFKPKMVSRILSPIQKEKVFEATKSALNLLSPSTQKQKQKQSIQQPYLTNQLVQTIVQWNSLLKEEQFDVVFDFDAKQNQQLVTKGNLQIRGIKYPVDGLFIHQIKSARIGDIVYCLLRDFVDDQSSKKQQARKQYGDRFKTDTLRNMILTDNTMQKQVEKYMKYKQLVTQKSFYNKFKSNLSVYSIIIDQISLKIRYKLFFKGKLQEQNNITINTKWLHQVEANSAESVKKQPRRIMFDIQDWHRGFFVPVFDFTHNN